jgi:23S rRNA (adenine-N6)-dimethyltransferase
MSGRGLGQHFLRQDAAGRFVNKLQLKPNEFVIEVGAGKGALTRLVSPRVRKVTALEIDAHFAHKLQHEFVGTNVEVLHIDGLAFHLPKRPFRIVANVPFGSTWPLIRWMLDSTSGLYAADLIVQWQVARQLANSKDHAQRMKELRWSPWWNFERGLRLPRSAFVPQPNVDACALRISKRRPAAIPWNERELYWRELKRTWR